MVTKYQSTCYWKVEKGPCDRNGMRKGKNKSNFMGSMIH